MPNVQKYTSPATAASATTDSNSLELKSCETNPQEHTGQQTPTPHKLSCTLEKHRSHRTRGHPAQDTNVHHSADSSCGQLLRQAQGYTHMEGGINIYREFLQWMPRREKPNYIKTKSMQEQVWPVPWGAPTFTVWYLGFTVLAVDEWFL